MSPVFDGLRNPKEGPENPGHRSLWHVEAEACLDRAPSGPIGAGAEVVCCAHIIARHSRHGSCLLWSKGPADFL